jgi:hypothetical protein
MTNKKPRGYKPAAEYEPAPAVGERKLGATGRAEVIVDETHSPMGTHLLLHVPGLHWGPFRSNGEGRVQACATPALDPSDFGFTVQRGDRFVVTVRRVSAVPGMKPQAHPFASRRR